MSEKPAGKGRSVNPLRFAAIGLVAGLAGAITATTVAPDSLVVTILLIVVVIVVVTLLLLRVVTR
ncbi:hypothetical protein L593_13440 [Salinarchaeum sp. Harcht-Bsk1]|uniref:hypothetical protein n=1 Tax=Salinarchaeum sp. Harcht-Bsk1 TaxID=1333523 RepID=UPI0003423A9C|nr:hypothetical protein [Salinarchaeum sp. Harcht-Bsk1]AGN02627.1 hypothetical protein L593_13440 [Salinarchaeum sp. Harcht-Bsk1]